VSALPSVRARVLAFIAILVAGLAGGLIGYAFVDIQCHGDCTTPSGIGGLTGAVFFAVGVAVISVLVLRAMGEWKGIKARQADEADQESTSRRNPSA
jgi:hypothetical protein